MSTMTTSEVAARLGVTRRTVMNWKREGRLTPERKVGPGRGMLLWSTAKVERFARETGR